MFIRENDVGGRPPFLHKHKPSVVFLNPIANW